MSDATMKLLSELSGEPISEWQPYDGRANLHCIAFNLPTYRQFKAQGAEVYFWCNGSGHTGFVAVRTQPAAHAAERKV